MLALSALWPQDSLRGWCQFAVNPAYHGQSLTPSKIPLLLELFPDCVLVQTRVHHGPGCDFDASPPLFHALGLYQGAQRIKR